MANPRKMKRFFWLSSSLIAAGCLCGSCSPDVDARKLLGSNKVAVSSAYYKDFIGIDPHGDIFDFQECVVDTTSIRRVIQSPSFAYTPDYSEFWGFYKSKLHNPVHATWQHTPLDSTASRVFYPLLRYGNLLDNDHSRRFIEQKYLTAPGNFYAYFAGWPAGINLYVLVPSEGRLFIIRKAG